VVLRWHEDDLIYRLRLRNLGQFARAAEPGETRIPDRLPRGTETLYPHCANHLDRMAGGARFVEHAPQLRHFVRATYEQNPEHPPARPQHLANTETGGDHQGKVEEAEEQQNRARKPEFLTAKEIPTGDDQHLGDQRREGSPEEAEVAPEKPDVVEAEEVEQRELARERDQ